MDEQVIIAHPDGRRYSVTREAFARLYAASGFTVEKVEEPADFLATGIPAPKRPGRRPVRKRV